MKPLVFRRFGRNETFAWFLYVGNRPDEPDGYLLDVVEAAELEHLRDALERIVSSPSVSTVDDLRHIAATALKGEPMTTQPHDRRDSARKPLSRPPILAYFVYDHLPEHLQKVSRPFADLALAVADADEFERNPETLVALRKLLEAKDAAVRAALR